MSERADIPSPCLDGRRYVLGIWSRLDPTERFFVLAIAVNLTIAGWLLWP